jgi:hypothetical protein
MVACSGKNPLENLFENTEDYINYVYPYNTTDVDIAYCGDIESEFEKHTYILYEFILKTYPTATIHLVDKGFDFKYSIKFKSEDKLRNVEVYRVKENIVKLIHKFHLCVVRQFFTGKNVYMLSECATSLMSGINTTYRYMANNTNPMNCILKYAKRGYTTILNTRERHAILKFINANFLETNEVNQINQINQFDQIEQIEQIEQKSSETIEDLEKNPLVSIKFVDVFGSFSINHEFFRNINTTYDKFQYKEFLIQKNKNNEFIVDYDPQLVDQLADPQLADPQNNKIKIKIKNEIDNKNINEIVYVAKNSKIKNNTNNYNYLVPEII